MIARDGAERVQAHLLLDEASNCGGHAHALSPERRDFRMGLSDGPKRPAFGWSSYLMIAEHRAEARSRSAERSPLGESGQILSRSDTQDRTLIRRVATDVLRIAAAAGLAQLLALIAVPLLTRLYNPE